MFSIGAETVNLQPIDGSTIRQDLARLRLPWWWRLGHRLLAARCVFCDRTGDLGDIDLCEACLQGLPWSVTQSPSARAGTCPLSVNTLFDYRPPVSRALIQLKFHADFRQAAVLGTLLGLSWRHVRSLATQDSTQEVPKIVPVPLHRHRLRERGFNQVAWLARYASYVSSWPVEPRLLQRVRATQAQTRLDAGARRLNLDEAFRLGPTVTRGSLFRPPFVRQASTLILLDDVVTTGATMEAASTVLQTAGEVHLWAVARAMPTNTTSPIV